MVVPREILVSRTNLVAAPPIRRNEATLRSYALSLIGLRPRTPLKASGLCSSATSIIKKRKERKATPKKDPYLLLRSIITISINGVDGLAG